MYYVFTQNMAWKHAQSQRVAKTRASKDGHWYARLVASNPRIVQSFQDHEAVVQQLMADGEVQTLFDIASGGFLDAPDSRVYRQAYKAAIAA